MEEAHHGHPTGKGVAGFAQRMNDKVAAKLVQIVAEGVTEIKQVRSLSTCTHTLTHKLSLHTDQTGHGSGYPAPIRTVLMCQWTH